jgi:hypothetical protein
MAANTSVAVPMFSEEYMGTHAWPSTKSGNLPTVPRCLEQFHMQAVVSLLREERRSNFLRQKESFYAVVRRKFSTARTNWRKKV